MPKLHYLDLLWIWCTASCTTISQKNPSKRSWV